jgi:hypothetical protein
MQEIVLKGKWYMDVNEVDGGLGNKDFCIVTWYSLDEKDLNAQRRFPMVAVDGEFYKFEPISHRLLREAKSLMRQYDAEAKLLTEWLDCEEDNYWVEENSEQGGKYITLVCVTSESYDDQNDKTITEQSIYLRDNCPYGWSTLVKSGAKLMVIEKLEYL